MWARALPHDIVSLSLARNKLYGPLGSATLGAASLEYLDLSTNNLTGPLSEDVGSLTLLRDLRLSGNKLTGSFPRDVTRLRRLRCLSLKDNNLVHISWQNITLGSSFSFLTYFQNTPSFPNERLFVSSFIRGDRTKICDKK